MKKSRTSETDNTPLVSKNRRWILLIRASQLVNPNLWELGTLRWLFSSLPCAMRPTTRGSVDPRAPTRRRQGLLARTDRSLGLERNATVESFQSSTSTVRSEGGAWMCRHIFLAGQYHSCRKARLNSRYGLTACDFRPEKVGGKRLLGDGHTVARNTAPRVRRAEMLRSRVGAKMANGQSVVVFFFFAGAPTPVGRPHGRAGRTA
ncbi:hypothetical protein QBC34DRAFT_196048 [Podospora aff. communis PSN243]|uniref:Uncharacterized protein n=1 Tax=Podospora aff. communis PSN243 TaxID=3040156 RepID=A0AAV9G689_9PEZI|nr:hypothetical protein QBC34DRAFT_196048 [Podospora aff. communis PSN243]